MKSLEIQQRVDMIVLGESLCEYTTRFVQEKLVPLKNELDGALNVEYVPFGTLCSFLTLIFQEYRQRQVLRLLR